MSAATPSVLAVLVLYQRPPQKAASWSFLCQALQRPVDENSLKLAHCLVYDNSPVPVAGEIGLDGVSYQSNPTNGGTASAYTAALAMAQAEGCSWLLFLDQDTLLPAGYLECATSVLEAQNAAPPAVLIPRIWHEDRLVSPAVISRYGSVTPLTAGTAQNGIPTAISSGLLVRVDALIKVLPLAPVFWLDYVDHMIFLGLARRGERLATMDLDIAHDLSIYDLGRLSATRLNSILAAEAAFCRALGPAARAVLPLRRLRRALGYLRHNPSLALTVLRNAFR